MSKFYLGFIKSALYPNAIESGWVNLYDQQQFMDMNIFSDDEPNHGWPKEMCVGAAYIDEEVRVGDIPCRFENSTYVPVCIIN